MQDAACQNGEEQQWVLFEVEGREVTVAFDGGQVVSDTGLLAVRKLDLELGILAEAAARLPDPRSIVGQVFSTADLLTQTVYQLLGGYFDCHDAARLRHDAVLQTIVGRVPGDDDATLASGSTLARFRYAFTRRERKLPVAERTIESECQAAQCARLRQLNRFLVDLFVKTRRTPPQRIVLDFDATADTTHGAQQLTMFHGYYEQWQYLPLLVFDGDTKFPLTGWLRSGTAHASWGAVETLSELVAALRAAWPGVEIVFRADTGFAIPEIYEFCERENVKYIVGYATNDVLVRNTQLTMNYAQALADLHDEPVQLFPEMRGYQAESWSCSRRVFAKCEVTTQGGPNRRFVVTNLTDRAETLYREVYTQRGDSAERAIQELKHGLSIDRLSSHRFFANAFAMQCHLLAYALFILFREANAAIPEVAHATLETTRIRVFKIGALVQPSTRRLRFHAASCWPGRELFGRVIRAVRTFTATLGRLWHDACDILPATTATADVRISLVAATTPIK